MLLSLIFLPGLVQAGVWKRQSSSPVIDLGYSQYRGTYDQNLDISSFVSMRYAAPPTGANRWQAPQDPPTTSGVQAADSFRPVCMQSLLGTASANPFAKIVGNSTTTKRDDLSSEDCLFLNVFTPGQASSSESRKLPVVVWIHGGAYVTGGGVAPSARDMVVESLNTIVAVQMQYRLGAFGFLSSAKVKNNGAVNAAILDQRFALQWVQKYISKFGGDPSQVTIWGESAGAGSVVQHIIADNGNTNPPLFRAAMTSSIYLPAQFNYNDLVPEAMFTAFAAAANCGLTLDQMTCLRQQSTTTLQNANNLIAGQAFAFTSPWVPVVDGSVITDRPTAIIGKGVLNGQALYSVTNVFEGTTFVPPLNSLTLTSYLPQFFPTLDLGSIQKAISLYQIMQPNDYHRAIGLMTEQLFTCPAYWLLTAFGKAGKAAYKGEFWVYPGLHAQDVGSYMPGILSSSDIQTKFKNSAFNTAFSGAFLSVVKSLDPNQKITSASVMPTFYPWSPNNTFEMSFSNRSDGSAAIGPTQSNTGILERCQFWYDVAARNRQ